MKPSDGSQELRDLPFRTGTTWLGDEELILLDVLFDGGAPFRLLRRDVFRDQWNLRYSHNLSDDELRCHLRWFCEHGVLETEVDLGQTVYWMTPAGGELWSSERCAVWDRYCAVRHTTTTSKGRSLVSVVAVSPRIRDDFLRLESKHRARRRVATIADYGLLRWHPFSQLHFGIVTDTEWIPEECSDYEAQWREFRTRLNSERSWWGSVKELQRFTPKATL